MKHLERSYHSLATPAAAVEFRINTALYHTWRAASKTKHSQQYKAKIRCIPPLGWDVFVPGWCGYNR